MELAHSKLSFLRLCVAVVGAGTLITGAVQGCGDDETTPPPEGIDFEVFADTYRQTQCERSVTCGVMPDIGTCYEALAQDLAIAQAIAAAAFGDISYDPLAAETCINTLASASCEGYSLLTLEILQACDVVFGDRRGEGEPCVAAAQCAGLGSVCEGSCGDGCCEGTCRGVEAAGMEGDLCSDIAPCGQGLRCLVNPTTMMAECLTLAGANETCVEFGCIEGYSCNPNDSKCFQQSTTGDSCNPALGDACASLNEYCDGEQQMCIPLPRPGDACGANPVSDQYCARMGYCVDGECVALPSAGEPCLGSSACIGQLWCDEETVICQPLPSPDICVNFE